jgi:hypothetical protein
MPEYGGDRESQPESGPALSGINRGELTFSNER